MADRRDVGSAHAAATQPGSGCIACVAVHIASLLKIPQT
jgi:hypothetical protein